MKNFLLYLLLLSSTVLTVAAQSPTQLKGKCPDSTRYATLGIQANGNINAVPCDGKDFLVNGVPVDGNGNGTVLPNSYAVKFDSTKQHNVYFGSFWSVNTIYWDFFADSVQKMSIGSEYMPFSGGFGGLHNILFGTSGCGGGQCQILGNVSKQDGSGIDVQFDSGNETFPTDSWVYMFANQSNGCIITGFHGVPSKAVVKTTGRMITNINDAGGFLGGSDHSNGAGWLNYFRLFENYSPLQNDCEKGFVLRPELRPQTQYDNLTSAVPTNFAAVAVADTINAVNHGLITGQGVWFSTTGVLPTGLTAGYYYYAIRIDADNFQVASTLTNAKTATEQTIANGTGSGTHTFYPETKFRANLLLNFSTPNKTIPDLSDGLNGIKHNGVLNRGAQPYNRFGFTYAAPLAANLPQIEEVTITRTPTTLTPDALPTGARIFDDFNENDVVYTWQDELGLGITDARASQGAKVWQDSSNYGILNGRVFSADLTLNSKPYVTDSTAIIKSCARFNANNNNYVELYSSYNKATDTGLRAFLFGTTVSFRKVVAGAETGLGFVVVASVDTPFTLCLGNTSDNHLLLYLNDINNPAIDFDNSAFPALTGTQIAHNSQSAFTRMDWLAVFDETN